MNRTLTGFLGFLFGSIIANKLFGDHGIGIEPINLLFGIAGAYAALKLIKRNPSI